MGLESQENPTDSDVVVDMGERAFLYQFSTCFLVCLRLP